MTRRRYKPMLAKESKAAFTNTDWIFEVKWDGFRAIAYLDTELAVRSRNQKELLNNFPELRELNQLGKDVVLDGEIVILNEGKADFQALLERGKTTLPRDIAFKNKRSPAAYVVFDILEKNGKSLLNLPLMERKRILAESVKEGEHVLLSDYVEEKGEVYFQAVLEKGLEGIIAKKKSSPYEAGTRSNNWLKIKKLHTCDCVVLGYTQGTGTRRSTLGALILGLYNEAKQPIYVGKVGTGFSKETLKEMLKKFQKIKTETAPFELNTAQKVTWLKPEIVCEIAYQVLTKEMCLRIPKFLRLRQDKKPEDCILDQLGEEPLREYRSKRNFAKTAEPTVSKESPGCGTKIFVVQEHHAHRLHFDFRLERDGVLKSWALPKGIPTTSNEKRLAVQVEDHPLDYAKFEGEIPKGEYGAGQVIVWDKGTYETKVWDEKMLEVVLEGSKLKGRYVLVPLKRSGNKNWLMLKAKN
jgi:bifunctional non-homologous end joining protein LigD